MLNQSDAQHYEALRQRFCQLQEAAAVGKDDDFQALFSETQSLVSGRVPEASLQAFQVEISKQWRLLDTDRVFLKAARQPATQQQRWAVMGDRLHLLMRYCEAILSTGIGGGDQAE